MPRHLRSRAPVRGLHVREPRRSGPERTLLAQERRSGPDAEQLLYLGREERAAPAARLPGRARAPAPGTPTGPGVGGASAPAARVFPRPRDERRPPRRRLPELRPAWAATARVPG